MKAMALAMLMLFGGGNGMAILAADAPKVEEKKSDAKKDKKADKKPGKAKKADKADKDKKPEPKADKK